MSDDADLAPEDRKAIEELEELGSALDALRLAAVALEIFPELKVQVEPWLVARAILRDETSVQKLVREGARLRDADRAERIGPVMETLRRVLDEHRPAYAGRLPAIRACIDEHFRAEPPWPRGATGDHAFPVIAASDRLASELLRQIESGGGAGLACVAELRRKIDRLLAIDEKLDR